MARGGGVARRRTRAATCALVLAGLSTAASSPASGATRRRPRPSAHAARLYLESRHALSTRQVVDVAGTFRHGRGRLHVVVRSTGRGRSAEGTFWSTSKATAGFVGAYSFVRIRGHVYLKGNAAFWSSSASVPTSVVQHLRARWIELPASYGNRIATGSGRLTNPSRLAAGFLAAGDAKGAAFEAPRRIGGQLVRPIRLTHGTLFVRRSGVPLPLVIVGRSAATSWSVRFGYPQAKRIAPPQNATTLRQLERSLGA